MHPKSSQAVLICAFGILAAFFMPWIQLFGAGMSGYNLGRLGSYGNYAWIIPILAGGTILVTFSGASNRVLGALTGIVPLGALAYALIRLSSEGGADAARGVLEIAQQVFSIGIYLTVIFSLAILVAAGRESSSTLKSEKKTDALIKYLKNYYDSLDEGVDARVEALGRVMDAIFISPGSRVVYGVIFGGLLGAVLSYWFQPGFLRMAVSLGEYMISFPDFFDANSAKTQGLQSTFFLSIGSVAIIGGIAALWFNSKRK